MKGTKLANRVGRLGWVLVAVLVGAAWGSNGASAQMLTPLVTFSGSNGSVPQDRGGLIADAHGNLFGTTFAGGAYGGGTVFEIKVDSTTPTGYASTPTTLVSFTDRTDGGDLYAGVIADAHGNLFGTALVGGAFGYGTVFEIKVDSTSATGYATTPTTLVSFNNTDGQWPFAGLMADASGNLFGTTSLGGASGSCVSGCGTLFEIKVDSTSSTGYATTPTTLLSFDGTDAFSEAAPIIDAHGNLFGTTSGTIFGGSGTSLGGQINGGTVFELKTDSTSATGYASAPTILVSFNGTDGNHPFAGLIADADGNLFGTTSDLFTTALYGTVFEIKTDSTSATGYASTPTTLASFNFTTDGAYPIATLIADAHGNLFGTAELGGVFEVTGSGFVPPTGFAGTPGTPNCVGVSISTLAQTYGGIAHAAMSLGYPSVMALQDAVKAYCGR